MAWEFAKYNLGTLNVQVFELPTNFKLVQKIVVSSNYKKYMRKLKNLLQTWGPLWLKVLLCEILFLFMIMKMFFISSCYVVKFLKVWNGIRSTDGNLWFEHGVLRHFKP